MATSGQGLDYQWFSYTDNSGGHWSMRIDKNWGALAGAGFAAFNGTYNVWPKSRHYRRRAVIGVDTVSGRKTTMPIGSATATIYAKGQTFTRYVRGLEDAVTFTVTKLIAESEPASNPNINNFPEYSEAA